jgi:hypothetical protein
MRGGLFLPLAFLLRPLAMTAALATALAVISAADVMAAPASLAIVGLVIDYDDDLWRVDIDPATRPLSLAAIDGPVLAIFNCIDDRCGKGAAVIVSATPVSGDAPPLGVIDPDDAYFTRPLWGDDAPAREINGLTVFAYLTFSGCRALSPSELRADVEHAGHRYAFASGVALGCGGVWSVGREAFLDLISGIRPAG